MKHCEKCIHYELCKSRMECAPDDTFSFFPYNEDCPHFKNKAEFVEVKHGSWVDDGFGRGNLYCSVCKSYPAEDEDGNPLSVLADWEPEFCPYCGAKMDGGRDT